MVNIKTTFRNTLYPVLYIVHINILEIDIRNLILFLDFYFFLLLLSPLLFLLLLRLFIYWTIFFFWGGGDGGSFILNPSLLKYLSDEVFFYN